MALYIGLDVGTTTLSTVVLDAETGRLLARQTVAHGAHATSPEEKARGRSELDLMRLRRLVIQSLAEITTQVSPYRRLIKGIGVTGQMHGVAFLGPDAAPLRPAITWEDRRAEERLPDGDETYLARFLSLAGGPEAFARTGSLPATGYLGPTLFWLHLNGQLPPPPARACFIPDAVVSFLTGLPPCTDPTDGGSSGIFDIVAREWDWALIARVGLPREIFPEVREAGEPVGPLLPALAAQVGLPTETYVFVALGDNQASFLGSVREPARGLLLNVGTGAQVSALVGGFHRLPGLDTRYFPGGRYLLVGAGLFGGRTYAYLRDFFRQVGVAFFGGRGDEEIYDEMTRLAAQVPPGAEGLRCLPTFTGTRTDPTARGSFTGITPYNLTPGHLIRALLEGMAEGFYQFYLQMQPLLGERTHLVGSGNGLRRNRLLAAIVARRFGLPLHIPALEEEAAVGAALIAAVGAGEWASLDAAASLLRYADTVEA
jgi:sugar (pentulose or hexulose) kinase